MIYLDNNSTTKPTEKVLGAMGKAPWANSNSLHKLGLEAKMAVIEAETKIRKAINATDGYILWTSGGAEANHIALDRENYYPGTRYICPATEHKSVLENEAHRGSIAVDSNGLCDSKKLLSECYMRHSNTIAQMMVNNETGVLQDISLIRKNSISSTLKIHTDAVQALGKTVIDVQQLRVDTLSISAHKIGGPKGIGVLWSKNELKGYRRPNTLNVPAIVGFGAAVEEIDIPLLHNHCWDLRERLVTILYNELNLSNKDFNGAKLYTIPSTVNISFKDIDAFELTQRLSDKGIYVSMGSACNAGSQEPSHVLIAMGLTPEEANSSIRISFCRSNTLEEVEKAAREIISCVRELRK